MQNKLFLPVKEVRFDDLYNWANPEEKQKMTTVELSENFKGLQLSGRRPRRRSSHAGKGSVVDCNKTLIALFRYHKNVFAVDEKCPHAGGPLHLGDIEEMPDKSLCIRCPWHSWRFDIHTGKVKTPKRDLVLQTYPVRLAENGTLYIGFDKFADEYFLGNEDF